MRVRPVRVQPVPTDRQNLAHSRRTDPDIEVPWTGFDLINAFNAWKKTEDAGRVFMPSTPMAWPSPW